MHVQLFDDLNKLTRYDEPQFLADHAQSAYVDRFSGNKNYLYNQLLDAMRSARQRGGIDKPIEFQIREWMEDAQFLKDKMLFDQSLDRLQKARREASRLEFHEILIEIFRMLRTHWMELQPPGYEKHILAALEEIHELSHMVVQKALYLLFRDRLFLQQRHPNKKQEPSNDKEIEVLIALDPDTIKWAHHTSTEANLNLLMAKALALQIQHHYRQAWSCYHSAYHLWKERKDYRESRQTTYLKFLNNFLTVSNRVRVYTDFNDALESLEVPSSRSKDLKAESKQNALYVRLQRFLNEARWEDANELEESFKKAREHIGIKLGRTRLLAFYLSFARLLWIQGKYEAASKYCKYCLDERIKEEISPRMVEAMLLKVLIRYDQTRSLEKKAKEVEAFQKELDAIERTCPKKSNEYRYFLMVIRTLKKVNNLPAFELPAPYFSKLQKQLHEQFSLPESMNWEAVEIMLDWANSKVDGISLADSIRLRLEASEE